MVAPLTSPIRNVPTQEIPKTKKRAECCGWILSAPPPRKLRKPIKVAEAIPNLCLRPRMQGCFLKEILTAL